MDLEPGEERGRFVAGGVELLENVEIVLDGEGCPSPLYLVATIRRSAAP